MKRIFQLINKNVSFLIMGSSVKKNQGIPPVITLSREMGSGGRPIAYLVAKKLGKNWKVYHKEIIEEIAQKTHLEKKIIQEIDENKIPLIEAFLSDIFGKRYPTFSSYYKNLVRVISTIGHLGNVIIIGRGAEYIVPHALKVRIICEMEQRINWEMEFEHLTRKQAIDRIKKSDITRGEFIKTLYRHDTKKAHHYDLVIRTGPDLAIEDAADLIVRAAKRRFKI